MFFFLKKKTCAMIISDVLEKTMFLYYFLENKKRREFEMKKIAVTIIVITFVFALANLSFAANEFQTRGIVTKINGNQITIKDDKGKETTIEGNASGIKAGDKILVTVTINQLYDRQRELTAEEKDFLTRQCLIDRADVEMIKQLSNNDQANILQWTAAKDCKKLTPFKVSREYYRKIGYDKAIPLAPAGWSINYLRKEEFERYLDILDKAPW
jgi:uncharacterized membrane protein